MAYDNNGGMDEAVLRTALAGALRLGRAVGVAPLSLRTHRGRTYARVSRTHALYGYILITIIGCGTIIEVFSQKGDDICRLPLPTVMASVFSKIKTVFTMIVVVFGSYSSYYRMKRLLRCLRVIEEVKLRVYYGKSEEVNNKMRIMVATSLLVLLFGLMTKCINTRLSISSGSKLADIALDSVYYIEHLVLMAIEFQIVFLMYAIQGAVRAMNEELARMHRHHSQTPVTSKYTTSMQNDVIGEVSRSYVAVCLVVRDFNRSEGALILLQLISFIANIVFVNYFLFDSSGVFMDNKKILLTVYYVYHTTEMMLLVDPGHQISQEMSRTRVLLSRLHNERVFSGEPLAIHKLLMLHEPVFSPLNMLPFDRPLTLSIISFISTTVATLLQYRLSRN